MVAGSLRRQQDTATICAATAAWDMPLEVDPRLNEYDHVALLRQQLSPPGFGPAAGRADFRPRTKVVHSRPSGHPCRRDS